MSTAKEWSRLLRAALIAYRLARLLVHEDGPFGVAKEVRTAVYGRVPPRGWIARGFGCVHCVAFWLALPALRLAGWRWADWLVVAGLVSVIYEERKR